MSAFWNQESDGHFHPPANHGDYLDVIGRVAGRNARSLGRTLDVGCNRAWACGLFDDYYGIDASEAAIQAAKAYWEPKQQAVWSRFPALEGQERFSHLPAKVERFSFADASFDLVFAKDVLEHMPDAVGGLREFHRVLKPEGLVFLCTPDAQRWVWNDPTHLRPYPLSAHMALAGLTGFEVRATGYESTASGTQKVARMLGRHRSSLLHRGLSHLLPFWPRNTFSVLQKPSTGR